LRNAFDPRRDVDAVAENVAILNEDIADIDAAAQFDAAFDGNGDIALGHGALDFNRASAGIHGAGKLHQSAVAGGFDDAAAILRNLRIDHFATIGLEGRQCAFPVEVVAGVCLSSGRCRLWAVFVVSPSDFRFTSELGH
jgi:hypothetical protein